MMRRSGDGKKCLEVASISGMYVGKDNCTYYQVHWLPSWESKDDIVSCEKIINEFHSRQEKEIFGSGGPVGPSKESSINLCDIKSSISKELGDFRTTINNKLNKLEDMINEQQKHNQQFSRRLGALENFSNQSPSPSPYYCERQQQQQSQRHHQQQQQQQPHQQRRHSANISVSPETVDLGSTTKQQPEENTNLSISKEEENNELYFEDMMYNEYMEGSMEPRRKRNRGPGGDIAVGIPVTVDDALVEKIKEQLRASNNIHKEAEVVHAVRVCNVRHILALKLAQIIFSDEELAAASYAPGNFKPLDEVKLACIEELSFMRFAPDENEVREISWGQIHQRIKNKCRCKRKIHNDKLIGMSYNSNNNNKVGSSQHQQLGTWSSHESPGNSTGKQPHSYTMATRSSFTTHYRHTHYDENFFNPNADTQNSSTSLNPTVYDLTDSDVRDNSSASGDSSNSTRGDVSRNSSAGIASEHDSGDVTMVYKEEPEYPDESCA